MYKLFNVNDLGVVPKLFKIIKFAAFAIEDMNYNRCIVHYYPRSLTEALHCGRGKTLFRGLHIKLVGKSLDLGVGVTGTDNKIIGNNRLILNVEQLNIMSLLVVKNVYYFLCKLKGLGMG